MMKKITVIIILFFILINAGCNDKAVNRDVIDKVNLNKLTNENCICFSQEEVSEKSFLLVSQMLKKDLKDYQIKSYLIGDSVWQIKLIPTSIQFGGLIELHIRRTDCSVKLLNLGK